MSIASFVEDTDTRKAYKQFCRKLYEIGITEDTIHQKGDEVLEILRSHSMVTNSQVGGSDIGGRPQLPEGCSNAETLYICSVLTYQQIKILSLH